MIKAAVFDLDGTLLNTITTIAYYGNKALSAHGLVTFSENDYKYFVGDGAKKLILRMLEEQNACTQEFFLPVYTLYNEIYDSAPTYLTEPYEGIKELISTLKSMDLKLAVLSNKPDFAVKSNIKEFFGDGFDIVCGGKEGVKLKPEPDALFAILSELNVCADECIYIGDTSVDMKTGKAAGALTVGVLWGFRDMEELINSGADITVSTPQEIIDIIKQKCLP